MNTPENERGNIPVFLNSFPYVNGGLFRNNHSIPQFSRKSRQVIIESGELDWSAINPDIFGSMIQAVITPEHRGGLGMHYTSVPNIMKVIEPLFLNDFYEEFDSSKGNPKKLRQLLNRLWNTKYFDPACGSGNFLIITYKELRKLEMKIFKELNEMALSNITLNQLYGIELDDFAHEVAILSLWLAEHQMNQVFFNEFGRSKPALPLTSAGNIVHGNACRLEWEVVCPKIEGDEIYILGNPPYLGSRNQNETQKEDMKHAFTKDYKSLDYVSCWIIKGSDYINGINAKYAFVTTNSICQGEQVSLLWPRSLNHNLEIGFAVNSFKWTNNAKGKAAVNVVIIGVRNKSAGLKYIYNSNRYSIVNNINPYLTEGNSIYINRRSKPISKFPICTFGSMPNDGGNLILNSTEYLSLIENYPNCNNIIKKYIGADDFLNGEERWCLVIEDEDLHLFENIPPIDERLNKIRNIRSKSTEKSTREMAKYPNRFYYFAHQNSDSIIIPSTTSERREYIPMGFLNSGYIISNSAQAIYGAKPYLFAVLSSKMHMVWVRSVAGKLESRIRYSSSLVYNNFPFPIISANQENDLQKLVYKILEEREKNSEKNLVHLYDPEKMPQGLRNAHHELDIEIEKCYRLKPFESDEVRLEYLFKLYEQMIDEEKSKGTLFEIESKPKKKKK